MRFHRLKQALDGITSKHRVPKAGSNSSEKPKDKATKKSSKAKELSMKRGLAEFSDDEDEPLARTRKRVKPEPHPEDTYVDSEAEEKRILQKRIKKEEEDRFIEERAAQSGIKREEEDQTTEDSVMLKTEQVVFPDNIKMEDGERHTLAGSQKEIIEIKDEVTRDSGIMEVDTTPTAVEDIPVKEEEYEALVEV
jgi:hypothetical protein